MDMSLRLKLASCPKDLPQKWMCVKHAWRSRGAADRGCRLLLQASLGATGLCAPAGAACSSAAPLDGTLYAVVLGISIDVIGGSPQPVMIFFMVLGLLYRCPYCPR